MSATHPPRAVRPRIDLTNLIAQSGGALVTPAGDAHAVADAILRLYREPAVAARMGTFGRAYAEQSLSRIICVNRCEHVLKRVIEGRSC